MATTPATPTAEKYGIETVTSGITVETEIITKTPQVEPVPDQKNATVNEIVYDTRIDLKLTYRGTQITENNGIVTYNGETYSVDGHEKAGTYNGLQRYKLSAHRFDNFPAHPAQPNQQTKG